MAAELQGWAGLRATRNGMEGSQLFGEGRQGRAWENGQAPFRVSGLAPWQGALVPSLALSLEKLLL